MSFRRSAVTALVASIAGLSSLWAGTDGWVAWTAESARRLSVLNSPQPLPPVPLRDVNGHALSLAGFDRPVVLMDFIHTRCNTVCISMGAVFRQLQRDLATLGLEEEVQLLSLTFDHAHDGPAELAGYLSRFSADTAHWAAAKFEQAHSLDVVLEQLGVVVIPDPVAGFVHNAGIYLVHRNRVVGIYDPEDKVRLLGEIAWRLTHG